MDKTIIALYDDFETAEEVLEDLADEGFSHEQITLIANDVSGEYSRYVQDMDVDADYDAEDVDAGEGAGFGALVGTLTGLGVALVPGLGPVLAAGPLAAALTGGLVGAATGAATGGIVAGLVDLGVSEEEAGYYAEGIRRGGTLVVATVDEEWDARVEDIMEDYDPIDIDKRAEAWRGEGWTRFDTGAESYSEEEVATYRESYAELDDVGEAASYMPQRSRTYVRDENAGDFETHEANYREHYNTYYGDSDYTYAQYRPAYRYGYILALTPAYRNVDWQTIEPRVYERWEERNEGTWEEFKDAIHHAWVDVKDALS